MSDDEDTFVRIDGAWCYEDRQTRFWVPLVAQQGALIFAIMEGYSPFVAFSDYAGGSIGARLEEVDYLGDAPPALGIKKLAAGSAVRINFGGERRIIWFTGETGELDGAGRELAVGQLMGDTDPVAVMRGVAAVMQIPTLIRQQKDAKAAWIDILTTVRQDWIAKINTIPDMPTTAELMFRTEDYTSDKVAISPDGNLLAASGFSTVWNWRSGAEVFPLLRDDQDGSNDVVFSLDGHLIATAGIDRTARLWRASDGEQVRAFEHPGEVNRVGFSSKSHILGTTCADDTVRLWSVETGELVRELGREVGIFGGGALSFHPTDPLLAISNVDTVVFWDLENDELLADIDYGISGWINGIYLRVGELFVIATSDNNALFVRPHEKVFELRHDDAVEDVCLGPLGTWIATASSDTTVQLWDEITGNHLFSIEYDVEVRSVAASADGQFLAIGAFPNVDVWQLQ